MYRAFEEFVGSKGILPNNYGVEFSIGPAGFNGPGLDGWIKAIWIYGCGRKDNDARKQWALALKIVHEFFERENWANPKDLYGELEPISLLISAITTGN